MSLTTSLRSSTHGCRTCLRPNARSWRISWRARSAAVSISWMSFRSSFLAVLDRAEREPAVAGDRGEQVVEVVCDAAGEAPDRVHLLRLAQLRLELAALVLVLLAFGDVAREREDQLGIAVGVADRGRLALEHDPVAVLVPHAGGVAQRLARLQRAHDHGVRLGQVVRMHELDEVASDQLVLRPAEHRLVMLRDANAIVPSSSNSVMLSVLVSRTRRVQLLALAQLRLRFAPLLDLALRIGEEARVLERERREAGELLEQRDLALAERAAVLVGDAEHADDPRPRAQRHAGDGLKLEGIEVVDAAFPRGVRVDRERLARLPHPPGDSLAALERAADLGVRRALSR